MTSERRAPLSETIRRNIGGALDELHTCLPAAVTSYDSTLQQASCKPLVKHAWWDETLARQVESLSVVTNIPVVLPGSAGFRLTLPISDGTLVLAPGLAPLPATTGLLLFSEASLEAWLGGGGQEVDPMLGDLPLDHRFQLTDGIFLPGLKPFGAPWGYSPQDHATFGADAGMLLHAYSDHIAVASALSELAAPAAQTAVRGTEFMADLVQALQICVTLLPSVGAVAAAFDPTAPAQAANLVTILSTMLAKASAAPAAAGTYLSPNLRVP